MNIFQTASHWRMMRITGPTHVMVSIRFGKMPPEGPRLVLLPGRIPGAAPKFEVKNYVREVLEGVEEANRSEAAPVEVEEIEIVLDDCPSKGEVSRCAMALAVHSILRRAREQDAHGASLGVGVPDPETRSQL